MLAPEVTGGVVVAYLVDGRLKLPKGTPVFEIGDEETIGAPAPVVEPPRERLLLKPDPATTASSAATPQP